MTIFDKVQPYISSEDGTWFNISFNTTDVSFKIIQLSYDEIVELLSAIEDQVALLYEAYHDAQLGSQGEKK